MSTEGSRSKEDLLSAARDRLSGSEPESDQERPDVDQGREIRYRGQVVRSGTGAAPGSGLRKKKPTGGVSGEVRAALLQIKQLYSDGLISRAEAEKKRSEILDRL